MRAIRTMVMVGAATAAVSLIGVSSAFADPSSLPPTNAIVGVGSDTTTPVFHQLTADYNTAHPSGPELGSWDAVDPATGAANGTIVTKGSSSSDVTCQITRPDGSSAGITALENTKTDGGFPCVNFARSSRAPATSDPNTIAFVSLARDAITWSSPKGTSSDPSPAPTTLTLTQLAHIYECSSGYTTWSDVGGTSSAAISPVLPQSGSGTRSTVLLAMGKVLGLGTGVSLTPGPCVVNGTAPNGDVIEENTGLSPGNAQVFGTTTSPNVDTLYIYAISAYIAQVDDSHSTSIWGPGPLGLHDVTNTSGTAEPPTTGSGTSTVINSAFPSQLWRTIYDVVPNAGTAAAPAIPTTPSNLQAVFDPSSASTPGWLCQSTAQADLKSYGFTSLGPSCGSVTDEQLVYG